MIAVTGFWSRALIGAVTATLCWLVMTASEARAASMTTNCAGLQAALNQAQNGDVITLDQLCTATNSGSAAGSFALASAPQSAPPSFTLEGQPGSGAGFDGTGVTNSLLWTSGNNAYPTLSSFTIRDLVFENASPASTPNSGNGGAISIAYGNYALTLDGDTFNNDSTAGTGQYGGALYIETAATSGSIAITNSTFSGNHAPVAGGAVYVDSYGYPTGLPIDIANNTFTSNAVVGSPNNDLSGGALAVADESGGVGQLTQSDNILTHNSVSGGTQNAYGGAETTAGLDDSFTGDSFSGNSIQAPVGSYFSEGSGLAIFNGTCSTTLSHVLTDEAIAGNSIADGATNPANAWGALYVGCPGYTGNNLTLSNSTISGNRGGGGTAGIWGDANDQLTLKNSILAGNSDGSDLDGFNGSGGSLTVSYSDLCSGSSPQAGAGNICANPKLVNAASGDVHETYSSPTIDAGSNPLVPSGLTADVYGQPRIQPKLVGGSPIVDMGAAEYPTVQRPAVTINTPRRGATYAEGKVVHSSFTCTEAAGGPGISSCTDQSGHRSGARVNTSTAGTHSFTVTAKSADGLTSTATVHYTVVGPPKVKITSPTNRSYTLNQRVHSSFRCTEGPGGPGIASCRNGAGARSGALIDTSTPGVHHFKVIARSKDGQTATKTVTYTVRQRAKQGITIAFTAALRALDFLGPPGD